MRYAKQKNIARQHFQIGTMDGIDRSSFADERTLQDAHNLTSDGKPYWKTRPPRGRWHLLNEEQDETNSGVFVLNDPISGACSLEEGLCWTTGSKIYIGGKPLDGIALRNSARKQLLPIGRDLFILPDGVLLHKDEQGIWQKQEAEPQVVVDHAVVCGNRIWGCRYGENADGEFVNEIFCSALGDPLTWNRYGTGADDCYCASVGAPGAFTGAAVLYDDVIFFKENSVFCVSGTQPSDFRVTHNEGRGVRAGCERSIARLGSSVVYCGTDGVYRTNGSYTVRLCDGFPPTALENAVGGVSGEKYYLAAHDQNAEKCMFVFTAGRDTYHCEDNAINVQYLIPQRNSLYMLCIPNITQIVGISLYWMMICVADWNAPDKYTNCLLMEGSQESDYGYAPETDIQWYALTNELDCATPDTKCIREVAVRFELGDSALLCVELRTDRGEIKQLGRFTGKGLRRRILHVSALPCEAVQLYFYGHGACTIRNVEIIFENAKGEESRV